MTGVISQRDIEAARQFIADEWPSWDHDHQTVSAQLMALLSRYRIATLEEAAKVAEGLRREVPYEHNPYPCTTTMGRIATAIRNLKGAGA